MSVPTIFLSAASDDLKEWRDILHGAFERGGCKVYTQGQSLGASSGDVVRLLRDHLDKSQYVIHLAGLAYGAEPDDPPFPERKEFRCSYTQFEYYYAQSKDKRVIAFVCGADFPYLAYAEKGEDEADREGRRKLQIAHRERLIGGRFDGTPLEGHRPLSESIADVKALLKAVAAAVGTIRETADPASALAFETVRNDLEQTAHAEIPIDLAGFDYAELRDRFCASMVEKLDEYDRQMNWSDRELTPLEAEVEMESRGAARPRIVKNITAAIRKDVATKSFLVVGDPGSGKSVSLRRLARELYAAVPKTGVVPIYVNLREWTGPKEPTDQDIFAFIKAYIRQFAGRFGQEFIGLYFFEMVQDGNWFFILDSFDEIPSVLDCSDGSERLRTISRSFDRFANDLHPCRTVLASRPFRRPANFRGRRLTVRPFRESQVRRAMRIWLAGSALDPARIVHDLFKRRPELAPALRNPFTADLIAKFIKVTGGDIPASYVAIFDSHIERMLTPWVRENPAHGLTVAGIVATAEAIALDMFQSGVGFEIDLDELKVPPDGGDPAATIAAMRAVRLVRLGGATSRRFSFVHRRFAEYFAVRGLRDGDAALDFESIPNDSRWRDALVVYCSVAPEAKAREIAEYCWVTIRENLRNLKHETLDEAKPCIHTLRFVKDAFRARPECLSGFRESLSDVVLENLVGDELVANWIAAECIPLISTDKQPEAIRRAFELKLNWIADTALRACRHLNALGTGGNAAIREYVKSRSTGDLLSSYSDLRFSFSLSDAFREQRRKLDQDLVSLGLLWGTIACWFALGAMALLPGGTGMPYLIAAMVAICAEVVNEITAGGLIARLRIGEFTGERRPLSAGLRGGGLAGIYVITLSSLARDGFLAPTAYLPFLWLVGIFPLDFWRSRKPWKLAGLNAFLIAVIFLSGFGVLLLDWIGNQFEEETRPWIVLIASALCLIPALYFGANTSLPLIPIAFGNIRGILRDRRMLADLTIHDRPTRAWVIRYCAALRSEWGRLRFLTHLRFRQLEVAGPSAELPNEAWVTPPIREAYMRLELQWREIPED